jgi:hypothetical protein
MKKIILLAFLFVLPVNLLSVQVVQRKADSKIVYRSIPEFQKGYGIKNAVAIYGGQPTDYIEVLITETQWTSSLPVKEKTLEERLSELEGKVTAIEVVK